MLFNFQSSRLCVTQRIIWHVSAGKTKTKLSIPQVWTWFYPRHILYLRYYLSAIYEVAIRVVSLLSLRLYLNNSSGLLLSYAEFI